MTTSNSSLGSALNKEYFAEEGNWSNISDKLQCTSPRPTTGITLDHAVIHCSFVMVLATGTAGVEEV